MTTDAVTILRLFNEKAERLDRLSFTQYVRDNQLQFSMSAKIGETPSCDVHGPSEEATDAFVLTLRYFVQDNESISIRQIGTLYESLPVSEELRSTYQVARASLNNYLNAYTGIDVFGERLTPARVFNVFMYGGLAHANTKKKEQFDQWAQAPFVFGLLQPLFSGVLAELLRFILWAHGHNLRAIEALSGSQPAQ